MKIARSTDSLAASGAVLLEVLLALALFVAAAAVVSTALSSSMESLERQRLGGEALNLASSLMAEIQLGVRPASPESSKPLEPPFDDWTWELALTPTETGHGGISGLALAEVVVRHKTSPIVRRLAQMIRVGAGIAATQAPTPSP
jgi:type II secretory pathway pseudopilin PulG